MLRSILSNNRGQSGNWWWPRVLVNSVAIELSCLSYFVSQKKEHHLLEKGCEGTERVWIRKMVRFIQKGDWTKWQNLNWCKDNTVKFLAGWLLPQNFSSKLYMIHCQIQTWGIHETSSGLLCTGRDSFQYLLSRCSKAFSNGYYCWCHN